LKGGKVRERKKNLILLQDKYRSRKANSLSSTNINKTDSTITRELIPKKEGEGKRVVGEMTMKIKNNLFIIELELSHCQNAKYKR